MTVFEYSAGGVVFRKRNDAFEVLLISDKNGNWTFPKGLIEHHEDSKETAKREIFEEVGLQDLTFVDTLSTISYFYRLQGNLIRKKVDYFLFVYNGKSSPKAQREEGIGDVRWATPKEALGIIGYAKTNKPVLEKAIKAIKRIASRV